MDNNSYEQEFIKNIKQTKQPASPPRPTPKPITNSSTPSLIVSIILGIIVLVESVALVIFAINYGEVLGLYGETGAEYIEGSIEETPESLSEKSAFNYDDEYNITAFNLVCNTEDGSQYEFTKTGTYQKTSNASSSTDSGTYSIVNNSAVVLENPSRTDDIVVYFDGDTIIDGTDFYTCDDV